MAQPADKLANEPVEIVTVLHQRESTSQSESKIPVSGSGSAQMDSERENMRNNKIQSERVSSDYNITIQSSM